MSANYRFRFVRVLYAQKITRNLLDVYNYTTLLDFFTIVMIFSQRVQLQNLTDPLNSNFGSNLQASRLSLMLPYMSPDKLAQHLLKNPTNKDPKLVKLSAL